MDIIELIKMTISTLNTVSVRGEEDMSAQLGAIQALKTVVKIMEAPPAPQEQSEVTGSCFETGEEVTDG